MTFIIYSKVPILWHMCKLFDFYTVLSGPTSSLAFRINWCKMFFVTKFFLSIINSTYLLKQNRYTTCYVSQSFNLRLFSAVSMITGLLLWGIPNVSEMSWWNSLCSLQWLKNSHPQDLLELILYLNQLCSLCLTEWKSVLFCILYLDLQQG